MSMNGIPEHGTLEHFQEKCAAVFRPECGKKQEDRALSRFEEKQNALAPAGASAFARDGVIGLVGLIAKGGNDCGT